MKAAHLLSDIYAPTAKAKQLYLDPRTKIVLCLVVSFIMLESTTSLVVNALQIALVALPLIFLLMLGKHKMAVYYLCAYVFASLVPQLLVPLLPDIINLLFTGMIALMTQILPGMMMAYFLIVSTSVSEFVTAMDRMHVPKSISVPMSVLFRFFPTIVEEYGHVRDAMRARGWQFAPADGHARVPYGALYDEHRFHRQRSGGVGVDTRTFCTSQTHERVPHWLHLARRAGICPDRRLYCHFSHLSLGGA